MSTIHDDDDDDVLVGGAEIVRREPVRQDLISPKFSNLFGNKGSG
jgi:hypothetical protein